MHFLDDSLLPENQEPLVIQSAPYGPQWLPGDSTDVPVKFADQIQKAVDVYNAGATVLHVHVREADGTGSKRLSMFNEMLDRLRTAVPKMVLQVGGSISFAPENEGESAKWLSDDVRHALAELNPRPDQVTLAVNTSQMNTAENKVPSDVAGTSWEDLENSAYREMVVPAGPTFVEEHMKRLVANGIQPHFQLGHLAQFETLGRMIRRGKYMGPLVLNWVSLQGGFDGPNPNSMLNFINHVPDGAVLTIEGTARNTWPLTGMGILLGLHVRCGIEDTLNDKLGERITSVQQVEKMVRVSREYHREIATGEDAHRIYKIGVFYNSVEETLAKNGFAPSRKPGQRGFTHYATA
ncbi:MULTISPECIES: 3-keto-5-aminohexanoate cleavage protein [unclassified Variovorax]|uniref:3-keto-5-aminohexanoate cleavage protein n=1 Tax=unclassified Variovorax TaxID=663243 RepID=UPI001BD35361|nr:MULTISPECIES: 3-keto-5-aminohexanoate cleavage protein [unclassified Variovorax]